MNKEHEWRVHSSVKGQVSYFINQKWFQSIAKFPFQKLEIKVQSDLVWFCVCEIILKMAFLHLQMNQHTVYLVQSLVIRLAQGSYIVKCQKTII